MSRSSEAFMVFVEVVRGDAVPRPDLRERAAAKMRERMNAPPPVHPRRWTSPRTVAEGLPGRVVRLPDGAGKTTDMPPIPPIGGGPVDLGPAERSPVTMRSQRVGRAVREITLPDPTWGTGEER